MPPNDCAQSGVRTVGFVAGHPLRGSLGRHGRIDQRCRQCRFGRETRLSSGIPASAHHRVVSWLRDLGRYSAQSSKACPRGAAYVRYTATWEFSTRPAVPLYWRCTPTLCTPIFPIAGFVDHQDRDSVAEGLYDVATQIVKDIIGVPTGWCQQVL